MTETSASVLLVLATAQRMPAFQRIRNSVECTMHRACFCCSDIVKILSFRYRRIYRESTGAKQLLNHPLICNRFNWSADYVLEKLVFVKQKPLSEKFFVVVAFVLFCFVFFQFHFFNSDPTQKQNNCLTTTEELTNRNIRLRNLFLMFSGLYNHFPPVKMVWPETQSCLRRLNDNIVFLLFSEVWSV